MKVIDLTHCISADMPVYPGTEPPIFHSANEYDTDGFRETKITMYSHIGTHIDAPAHLFPQGETLDELSEMQFVGRALVVDCRNLHEGESITLRQLEQYGDLAVEADFLLFLLGWDDKWGTDAYFGDYPCLDDDVIRFVLNTGKKGVGFDVIGIDPVWDQTLSRHKALLSANVVIIENLCHLNECGEGLFWFFALPLKFCNADGAPVRAVAFWS